MATSKLKACILQTSREEYNSFSLIDSTNELKCSFCSFKPEKV